MQPAELTQRLTTLINTFERYEEPLKDEDGKEAIQLMRDLLTTFQEIEKQEQKNGENPIIAAAIVQVNAPDGKRPRMFVDWMTDFYYAKERAEELILQCIAYAPYAGSIELKHLQKRQAIVKTLERLAQSLQKIPVFAERSSPRARERPEYLQVVEAGKEEETP